MFTGLRNASIPQATRLASNMSALSRTFRRSLFIQTESTPNKDSLKFIPTGKQVLGQSSGTMEFLSATSAAKSPLAVKLFQIEGVVGVMYGSDWVSISKGPDSEWPLMKPDIYGKLMDHFSIDGNELLSDSEVEEASDTKIMPGDSEVVIMIKELIETRIRPTIQEDGGDLEYINFTDEGIVQVQLKGACRTCDSSVVTLKNGIESMLMHYVEEIKGVEQVESEEDRVGNEVFNEFEHKIKELKGRK